MGARGMFPAPWGRDLQAPRGSGLRFSPRPRCSPRSPLALGACGEEPSRRTTTSPRASSRSRSPTRSSRPRSASPRPPTWSSASRTPATSRFPSSRSRSTPTTARRTAPSTIRSDAARPRRTPTARSGSSRTSTRASRATPAARAASPAALRAQTNTFGFGSLEPGEERTIVWRVTPVQAGTYTLHYHVAAGLDGKAVAVTADGGEVKGEFVVTITDKPPQATRRRRRQRRHRAATGSSRASSAPRARRRCWPALLIAGCGCDDGDDRRPTRRHRRRPRPRAPTPSPSSDARDRRRRRRRRADEIGSFEAPLYVTQPPGEDEDLYVVEQGGTIQRVGADGGEPRPSSTSPTRSSRGGEQGLLSVAFAPDYERRGLLYVYFTDPDGDTARRRVPRASRRRGADAEAARELLRMDDRSRTTTAGCSSSVPTTCCTSAPATAAARTTRSATARTSRRCSARSCGSTRRRRRAPYSVPAANPFADDPGARGEIYSYGLRNPWRFSFDRDTGALAIGDVGQDELEEVDLVAARRGRRAPTSAGPPSRATSASTRTRRRPARSRRCSTYATTTACSVTGGYVVRDRGLPTLYGRYLYGDFCARRAAELHRRAGRGGRRRPPARPRGRRASQLRRGQRRHDLRDLARRAPCTGSTPAS